MTAVTLHFRLSACQKSRLIRKIRRGWGTILETQEEEEGTDLYCTLQVSQGGRSQSTVYNPLTLADWTLQNPQIFQKVSILHSGNRHTLILNSISWWWIPGATFFSLVSRRNASFQPFCAGPQPGAGSLHADGYAATAIRLMLLRLCGYLVWLGVLKCSVCCLCCRNQWWDPSAAMLPGC